jgi:hypothetical protein
VNWIHLAEDRVQWALVNTVMDGHVPEKPSEEGLALLVELVTYTAK